jgi:hypothetical protein
MVDAGATAASIGEGDCFAEQASGVMQTAGTQFREGLSALDRHAAPVLTVPLGQVGLSTAVDILDRAALETGSGDGCGG